MSGFTKNRFLKLAGLLLEGPEDRPGGARREDEEEAMATAQAVDAVDNWNEDQENKWRDVIAKWDPVFKAAGFDQYSLDFSDIEPELIDLIGQTVEKWLAKKKEKPSSGWHKGHEDMWGDE